LQNQKYVSLDTLSSTADFLHRLRQFVHAEADAQWQALDRQWSRPLGERVAKGWTIEGLKVVSFDKNIVRLVCDSNHSRFREGDLVVLHRNGPQDPNALHFDLYYDGETELEASLIKGNFYFMTEKPDGWILDQDWFDSSPFYLSALDTIADSQLGRTTILPLLQGALTPRVDFARYERARERLRVSRTRLNES